MGTGQRYFGMTLVQIGMLAGLALVACIAIGVLVTLMLNPVPFSQQTEATYTLQPSPTSVVTSTPWPTVTPIPNWQEYSFADGRARIWLPASYIGGEPATSSEMIKENLRTAFEDEAFVSDIEGLLAIPEIDFFAFDTEFVDSARFMYVGTEALDPDLSLSMDYYLNRMMDNFTGVNERVVERQIARLDHYQAGRLVVESKVPAGDTEKFVTTVIYMVRVNDTMWFTTFRTGREEYKDYQQIIQTSANSFWVQP
jgi:hypothetical protein